MKHFIIRFHCLTLILVSLFFCFITNVSAQEKTYAITNEQLALTDNLSTMLSTIANSQYSTKNYEILAQKGLGQSTWEYVLVYTTSTPYLYFNTTWNNDLFFYPGSSSSKTCFTSDFSDFTNCSQWTGNVGNWDYAQDLLSPEALRQLIYTSMPVVMADGSPVSPNTYIYTHGDLSFTFDPNSDPMPTLYTLKEYFFQPPPDNYSILTSYYSLMLEKLTYVCDYITSHEYLLIFPAIIFFYFIFTLIRRYFL